MNTYCTRRSSQTASTRQVGVTGCLIAGGIIALSAVLPISAAYGQERWFKIEVSIFSNESEADRLEENWQPNRTNLNFPDDLIRLGEINDILLIDEFIPVTEEQIPAEPLEESPVSTEPDALTVLDAPPEPTPEELILQTLLAVKPAPPQAGPPFKFVDIQRDEFLRLPAADSDFTQTNRTLDRSPTHRLLWHGLWRQAVLQENEAKALYVAGGERYNERYELEGSLTIRFNDNADRVVIDSNLWLTDYLPTGPAPLLDEGSPERPSWQLPTDLSDDFISKQQQLENAEEANLGPFTIERIYHMTQSRGMRSGEFHYLDHPAMGIVVMVNPYEVPEIATTEEP